MKECEHRKPLATLKVKRPRLDSFKVFVPISINPVFEHEGQFN